LLKIVKHLEMTIEALFVCPPDNLQKAILVKSEDPCLYAFVRKTTVFVAPKARVSTH